MCKNLARCHASARNAIPTRKLKIKRKNTKKLKKRTTTKAKDNSIPQNSYSSTIVANK
jgi:hypothetical protein